MAASRARKIFSDSRFMIIVIESVEVQHSITNKACRLFGYLKPIALLVHATDTTYALDMKAKPITIDQLRLAVPDFDGIIASFIKP